MTSNVTIQSLGNGYVGGLVGGASVRNYQGTDCEIINSTSSSSISVPENSTGYVGGIVGYHSNGNITNSSYTGSIFSPNGTAGAIAGGFSSGTISDSTATGQIQANIAGGLVGQTINAVMVNCYSPVTVIGIGDPTKDAESIENIYMAAEGAGGLIGDASRRSHIYNSYATGDIRGALRVGGLVGVLRDTELHDSFFTGNVISENIAGGLIGDGRNAGIYRSSAVGNVTGPFRAGGLAGILRQESAVNNTFSTGTVTSQSIAGGLVGVLSNSTLAHSFVAGKVLDDRDEIADPLENGIAERSDVIGGSRAGGLVGYAVNSELLNTYTTIRVVSEEMAGELIANMSNTRIVNSLAFNEYVNGTSASRLAGTSEAFARAPAVINSYGWCQMQNVDQPFTRSDTNASGLVSARLWSTYPEGHEVWNSWDGENWTVNEYDLYLLPSPAWEQDRFVADARHLIPRDTDPEICDPEENTTNVTNNTSSGGGSGQRRVSSDTDYRGSGNLSPGTVPVFPEAPGVPVARPMVIVLLFMVAIACFAFIIKEEYGYEKE